MNPTNSTIGTVPGPFGPIHSLSQLRPTSAGYVPHHTDFNFHPFKVENWFTVQAYIDFKFVYKLTSSSNSTSKSRELIYTGKLYIHFISHLSQSRTSSQAHIDFKFHLSNSEAYKTSNFTFHGQEQG